ncbi:MAG: ABC transporter permease [Verrucomicrobia bacterium]|nr:ABC transporter permease [Verrucomicrobiota bacterium]
MNDAKSIANVPAAEPVNAPASPGPWHQVWRRLRRNPSAMFALWTLSIIVALCIGGSIFFQQSQIVQDLKIVRQPPSLQHWFGTDALGRDVLKRTLCGGSISLLVGVVATLVAVIIGTIYGLISGLAGKKVDNAMMRLVDILYGFPFIAFVVLLSVICGPSLLLLFVAIGAVEWLTTARVVRGQVLGLKNQEFVLASRACGAGLRRILWHHLLPNVVGPVVIYASLTVPGIMLLEAVLSFLGLGVQAPNSSWGSLIQEGASNMEICPWLLAFPGAFFVTTLLSLNLLGDALRDALDPKSLQ